MVNMWVNKYKIMFFLNYLEVNWLRKNNNIFGVYIIWRGKYTTEEGEGMYMKLYCSKVLTMYMIWYSINLIYIVRS